MINAGLAFVLVCLGTGIGFLCGMMIGSERAYSAMNKEEDE